MLNKFVLFGLHEESKRKIAFYIPQDLKEPFV